MTQAIQGMDKLLRQLQAIARANYTPALEEGVKSAVLPEMQRRTPVDTGDLKQSERVEVRDNAVVLVAGNGESGGNVNYAIPVEFGTSKMSAQAYMRPAIDAKSNEALKIAAKKMDAIIERVI